MAERYTVDFILTRFSRFDERRAAEAFLGTVKEGIVSNDYPDLRILPSHLDENGNILANMNGELVYGYSLFSKNNPLVCLVSKTEKAPRRLVRILVEDIIVAGSCETTAQRIHGGIPIEYH